MCVGKGKIPPSFNYSKRGTWGVTSLNSIGISIKLHIRCCSIISPIYFLETKWEHTSLKYRRPLSGTTLLLANFTHFDVQARMLKFS
jgi:hypothetical protein